MYVKDFVQSVSSLVYNIDLTKIYLVLGFKPLNFGLGVSNFPFQESKIFFYFRDFKNRKHCKEIFIALKDTKVWS